MVVGVREIPRPPFTVDRDDLASRDASQEEATAFRIPGDSLRDQPGIGQSQSHGGFRRTLLLRFELPANRLELFVRPERVEPQTGSGNQAEMPAQEAAELRQRSRPLAQLDMGEGLVIRKQPVLRTLRAQRRDASQLSLQSRLAVILTPGGQDGKQLEKPDNTAAG